MRLPSMSPCRPASSANGECSNSRPAGRPPRFDSRRQSATQDIRSDPLPISTTEIEASAIEHQCAKLYHRLGMAADGGFEGFVDCMSRDVVWIRPGMTMVGHEQVSAYLGQEKARIINANGYAHLTRHVYTTIVVERVDGDHATGRA